MPVSVLPRFIAATIAGASLVLTLAGCGSSEPTTRDSTSPGTSQGRGQSPTTTKSVDPRGRRTDPQPLVDRFSALGTPQQVAWVSGTIGQSRVPGPTTYWIDAIITLSPEQAAGLIKQAGTLVPVTLTTNELLAPDRPVGVLSGSQQLNQALSTSTFGVQAGLGGDHRTLVLQAISR